MPQRLIAPQEPDIDALLRDAHAALDHANTFDTSVRNDVARASTPPPVPPTSSSFFSDLGSGLTSHPWETIKGFFSGAKDPAIRVGKRLGENALGLAQTAITPPGDAAASAGTAFGRMLAFGNRPAMGDVVKTVTGVDPREGYPEMATDALTSLLMLHGGGVEGPAFERTAPRLPDVAQTGGGARGTFSAFEPADSLVGPRAPRQTDSIPLNPRQEPPIPVAKLGRGQGARQPVAQTTGAPERAYTPKDRASPDGPFTVDAPVRHDPLIDRYAPNRSASETPPSSASVPQEVSAPPPDVPNAPDTTSPLAAWLAKYGRETPLAPDVPETPRYDLRSPETIAPFDLKAALTPEKPKLNAADVKAMFERRQKFAKVSPEGFRPGMHDALDRSGVEYRRAQEQFKAGQVDNATARDLGKLLKATERDAVPVPGEPVAQMVAPTAFGGSEAGGIDPQLLARFLGVPVGGAIGAATGDPEHRGRNAAIGAGAGLGLALGGPAIARTIAEKGPAIGTALRAHQVGSLLASPTTLAKIGISNTSSALMKAAEHSVDAGSFSPLRRLFGETVGNLPQMGRDAVAAFKAPGDFSRDATSYPSTKGLPFNLATKAVGAVDAPFRLAMERAGFPEADALTVTQQRQPNTTFGKDTVRWQQNPVAGAMVPFLKSKMNELETGIVEPFQAGKRVLTGEGAPSDLLKAAMPAAVGAAAYAGGDAIDELPLPIRMLALSAGGLYNVPAAMGYAAHAGKHGAGAAYKALTDAIPLSAGFSLDPAKLMSRIIPRWANPDTWTGTKRDTSGGALDPLEAQIPGLAQRLPEKTSGRRPRHPEQ